MDSKLIEDIDQIILALDNGDFEDAKALLEEIKDDLDSYNYNFNLFLN